MLGWIICAQGMGKAAVEHCVVGGVPLEKLTLSPVSNRLDRYRCRRALEEMCRRGVHCAAAEGEIPEKLLDRAGIEILDVGALRRALLPQLLDWVQSRWQLPLARSTVLLCADSADGVVWQAALTLSRRARYISLDIGTGQEVLEQALRYRCGLSCGGGDPVLQVCLGKALRGGIPALDLGRGCGERQRVLLVDPVLPDAGESLLSAIFQAEKLPVNDVEVRFVEYCEGKKSAAALPEETMGQKKGT